MMTDTMSVSGNCPCGERVTWEEDDTTDDTQLVCKSCGAELGSFGSFRAQAVDAVKEKVRKMLKDAIRS